MCTIILLMRGISPCLAQISDSAENYIIKLRNEHQAILKEFLQYSGAVVHSRSKEEAAALQTHLITMVDNSLRRVSEVSCHNKDCSLRDSLVSYLTLVFRSLKEDRFQKLYFNNLNQLSYNEVETILSGSGIIDKEIHQKAKNLEAAQYLFAKKFNVVLSSEKDTLSGKIELINSLNDYYKRIFLIFLKSYKLGYQLFNEIDSMGFDAAEYFRIKQIEATTAGLLKLDSIKSFEDDSSLIIVCSKILLFYQYEAKFQVPLIIDYLKRRVFFEKKNQNLPAESKNSLNDAGLDEYNRETEALNKIHEKVVVIQHELLQQRNGLIYDWNLLSRDFMKKHILSFNLQNF
ncbi:MAG: hypothetical protein R6W78_02000 [Bacteroidales bacterium]